MLEEIGTGDLQDASNRLAIVENISVLVATDSAKELAKALIAENAIPASSAEDALHISIALCKVWIFCLHGISST